MATEDDKTVIGTPLARAHASDDRTVMLPRPDIGRTRSGLRPDPAGRLGRRASYTQEPATVVLSALSAPPVVAVPSRDANGLLAAATPLFLLLGHLRSGRIDTRDATLADRLSVEFSAMEHHARASGLDEQGVEDCLYVVAATIDDVMRNLPGAGREAWTRTGIVARRFGYMASPDAAFRRIEQALVNPAAKVWRLEVMLACLSLGLGGASRDPDDIRELARWREVLARTLVQVAPRKTGLSPCWHPVIPDGAVKRSPPVWVAAAVGALAVLVLFLPLASDLSRMATAAESRIVGMHQGLPALTLVRHVAQERTEAPSRTPQLDRLAEGLQGLDVSLDVRNGWVLLRPPPDFGFDPGNDILAETAPQIAATLAQVLNDETGPVRVIGHTDDLPLSGRGPFRTNAQLSAARAQAMADLLAPHLSDPSRLRPEGRGALEPIADNATPEGRARNRRVEIMIRRAP